MTDHPKPSPPVAPVRALPGTPNSIPPRVVTPRHADEETMLRFDVLMAVLPHNRDRAKEYADWIIYGPEDDDEDGDS